MFCDNLRKAREKAGLSQKDVANELSFSAQAVGKWERGESTPGPDSIAQMALLYGVSADALLDIKKDPAGAPSEAKKAMYDLIDTLSDEQISRLVVIAKAALAL